MAAKRRKEARKAAGKSVPKPTARPSTPRWTKSPPELVKAFAAALPDDPRVEPRQMFGYPAAFANGQLFTGLHQDDWMLRLGEREREELLALPGARRFEPMPGRVMREYVVLPASLHGDRRTLRAWVARAFAHASSLPPKKKAR